MDKCGENEKKVETEAEERVYDKRNEHDDFFIRTTTIGLSPFSRFAGSSDILSRLRFLPFSHSLGVSSAAEATNLALEFYTQLSVIII